MLALRIYLCSSTQLMQQLEAVSGMDVDIHLVVDEGLWGLYEALAIHDVLTNLYKGDIKRVKFIFRQGSGMLNLIAGAAVPRENRLIYKHALCFFHDLERFGWGSFKDLEVVAEQASKDHETFIQVLTTGWDISVDKAEELMKAGSLWRADDIIGAGARLMDKPLLGVEYLAPEGLRERLEAILKDETMCNTCHIKKEACLCG